MRIMAPSGHLTKMLLATCFLLLAVSSTQAHVYFSSGEEAKSGLLGPAEYGQDNGETEGEGTADKGEGEEVIIPDWNGRQLHAGLNALKHSLQSQYPTISKRSWLPGSKTGLFGKRGDHWQNPQDQPEKRQLWANQQSGLFGKRYDGRELTLPRWLAKRSAEESEFGRERRKGGVPHVFQSGGIFGKRSSDDWATRYE